MRMWMRRFPKLKNTPTYKEKKRKEKTIIKTKIMEIMKLRHS